MTRLLHWLGGLGAQLAIAMLEPERAPIEWRAPSSPQPSKEPPPCRPAATDAIAHYHDTHDLIGGGQ